jgi:hypothetical protein
MGILVGDEKTFSNGLTLSNFVVTVKGTLRGLEKKSIIDETGTKIIYRVYYTLYYYANQASYQNSCNYLDTMSECMDLNEAEIINGIFIKIYEYISSRFNTVTNLL